MTEPQIVVGILSGKEIQFSFPDEFISSDGMAISGIQQAVYRKGKIYWQEKEYDELSFIPRQNTSSFFELQDVTIGINFHWERKEVQRFKGELKIIVEDDKLTAINIISIEDYLTSVISSEMSATASLELLKAHAVISRSWLLNKLRVVNKLRVENGELRVTMQPDNAAHSPLSTLHSQLINGTTMKPTRTLTYVPTTIANVIKGLHVPQLRRLLRLFPLHGVRCLCMKERFVTPASPNAAAVLSKNSRTAGRM